MNTYTYSEARKKLAALLDKAKNGSIIFIKRRDGSIFELKALAKKSSPLDVKGVDIKINRDEIVNILKEVRQR